MPASGGNEPSGVTLWDWLPTQFQATVSPTLMVVWHTPLANEGPQNQTGLSMDAPLSPTSMLTVTEGEAGPLNRLSTWCFTRSTRGGSSAATGQVRRVSGDDRVELIVGERSAAR